MLPACGHLETFVWLLKDVDWMDLVDLARFFMFLCPPFGVHLNGSFKHSQSNVQESGCLFILSITTAP